MKSFPVRRSYFVFIVKTFALRSNVQFEPYSGTFADFAFSTKFRSVEREYFLDYRKTEPRAFCSADMKIMIPVDKSDEIGVRNVISANQVDDVIGILGAPSTEMSGNWNRRYRENMEKLKTGKISEVAEVVRNLMRTEREKHLSTGEKKMLTNACQILKSEIILAIDIEPVKAEEMICNAV